MKLLSKCSLGETWVGWNIIWVKRSIGWNVNWVKRYWVKRFGWNIILPKIGWNVIGRTVTTPLKVGSLHPKYICSCSMIGMLKEFPFFQSKNSSQLVQNIYRRIYYEKHSVYSTGPLNIKIKMLLKYLYYIPSQCFNFS